MKLLLLLLIAFLHTQCVNQEIKELQDIVFADDKLDKKSLHKRKRTIRKSRISIRTQKQNLAKIIDFINQDKLSEAEGLLNTALKSKSYIKYRSDLYFLKSSILVIHNSEKKALHYLRRGLKLKPDHAEARELFTRLTGRKYFSLQNILAQKKEPKNTLNISPLSDLLSRVKSNDFDTEGEFTYSIEQKTLPPAMVKTIAPKRALTNHTTYTIREAQQQNTSDPLFANEEKNHVQSTTPVTKKKPVKMVKMAKVYKPKRVRRNQQKHTVAKYRRNQPSRPLFNDSVIIIDETELD